jgi:DNA-binding transcriptional LysR family regulator
VMHAPTAQNAACPRYAFGRRWRRIAAISVPCSAGRNILPLVIKLFRFKHAGIAITVKGLHSSQIVATFVHQEADVGILFRLVPETLRVALAHAHPAEGRMVSKPPFLADAQAIAKIFVMAWGKNE